MIVLIYDLTVKFSVRSILEVNGSIESASTLYINALIFLKYYLFKAVLHHIIQFNITGAIHRYIELKHTHIYRYVHEYINNQYSNTSTRSCISLIHPLIYLSTKLLLVEP